MELNEPLMPASPATGRASVSLPRRRGRLARVWFAVVAVACLIAALIGPTLIGPTAASALAPTQARQSIQATSGGVNLTTVPANGSMGFAAFSFPGSVINEGTHITVTAGPVTFHRVASITMNGVPLSITGGRVASFDMPAGPANVVVTFEIDPNFLFNVTALAVPAAGGSVVAAPTQALPGTVVQLTAAPAAGWEFTGWTVGSGTSVQITGVGNPGASFTMPSGAVEVRANFVSTNVPGATPTPTPTSSPSPTPTPSPCPTPTPTATPTVTPTPGVTPTPPAYEQADDDQVEPVLPPEPEPGVTPGPEPDPDTPSEPEEPEEPSEPGGTPPPRPGEPVPPPESGPQIEPGGQVPVPGPDRLISPAITTASISMVIIIAALPAGPLLTVGGGRKFLVGLCSR